jgi:hypothetical protein
MDESERSIDRIKKRSRQKQEARIIGPSKVKEQ